MAITVDWSTYTIHVDRASMVQIQATPTEIWELDIPTFKEYLGDVLDNPEAITYPDIFVHYPPVSVGGTILARVVEILAPYTITFEDDKYAVNLIGANSNIGDRINVNQVSVRSSNSAGLQVVNYTSPEEMSEAIWAYSQRGLTNIDANIISVNGTSVVDIDDFKADLSGIAYDVWNYVTRELTQEEFNANIIKVNDVVVNTIDEFKADVSNLSADVNVIEVNGVVVNSIEDFKQAEFDGNVNVVEVGGVTVTSPDDLKADVSNLSADVNVVEVAGQTVTSIDEFKADISNIDLSTIPEAVWTYLARTLTDEIGMTPEQEAKLDEVLLEVQNIDCSGSSSTIGTEWTVTI